MASHTTDFFTDNAENELSVLAETKKIPIHAVYEQRLICNVHEHRFKLIRENNALKKAQQSLESSRRRYHSLYLNAPVGYFTFTHERLISDANHAAARLLQTERDQLIGSTITAFCIPSDEHVIQDHLRDVFKNKKPQTCQITMIRKDGQQLNIQTESVIQCVENRWEVQSTMLDITDRIHIEQALRQSEQMYREIVETTQEGVWVFDSKMRISYANPRLAAMLGYSISELIGKHLFEFIDVKEKDFLQTHQFDRRNRGIREKQLLKKDKTWLWVVESSNPLVHDDGYYLGRLGMLTDISQQKKVELDLKRAQTLLEQRIQLQVTDLRSTELSLQEQTTHRVRAEAELTRRQQALEAVYAIATAFRGTSKAMLERVLTSISDVLDIPCCSIGMVNGSQFSLLVQKEHNKIGSATGSPVTSGFCGLVLSQGTLLNLSIESPQWATHEMLVNSPYRAFLGMPITDFAGETLGAVCILDTERRSFCENDVHFIELFARYISNHITQEHMQNQLIHSQEMRMLGQLTSGVAHEVRNPLNAIVAITEALFQDLGQDSQYTPYLEHVRMQVDRLSALMQDLLDLGKPERQFNLKKMPVQMIVESSVEAWRQSSPNRDRHVRIVLPQKIESYTVKADSLKIQQVFCNLIDNACHHSDVSTGIDVAVMVPDDGQVRIQVVDSGCGVKPEDMPRLFEPFYTTRKGGTGLGLSVVRHIVSVHGGRLTVANNDPAPGLTVEMSFPVLS